MHLNLSPKLGLCFILLVGGASPSLGCTFSREDLENAPKSSAEFFSLPDGAIAIAEQCDPSTNFCKRYYDITPCTEVDYPVSEFDDPSFNFVINTSKGCADAETRPIEASYLAATVVYINNQTSRGILPTVQVIRNKGWFGPYSFEQEYRIKLTKSVPDTLVPFFFQMQSRSSTSTLKNFENNVVKYFHANLLADYDTSSWEHKEIFGDAFTRWSACTSAQNLCTLNSYLFAFTETPTGPPTNPLRVSAVLASADGVYIRTYSPAGSSIYNRQITVHFNWPAPLPTPRPNVGETTR